MTYVVWIAIALAAVVFCISPAGRSTTPTRPVARAPTSPRDRLTSRPRPGRKRRQRRRQSLGIAGPRPLPAGPGHPPRETPAAPEHPGLRSRQPVMTCANQTDAMTAARAPRRALIVSADVGEGRDSAARALESHRPGLARLRGRLAGRPGRHGTRVRRARPDLLRDPGTAPALDVRVLLLRDVAAPLVPGVDPARMGARFGRRMRPRIRAFDPDVIVSTYPLGSAGLSWLRRRGELATPSGAWVAAFCPHPSWLYPNLDITHVMHPTAADIAAQAEPGIRVAVGAMPVRAAFAPADRRPPGPGSACRRPVRRGPVPGVAWLRPGRPGRDRPASRGPRCR